jgi:putative hemolysin
MDHTFLGIVLLIIFFIGVGSLSIFQTAFIRLGFEASEILQDKKNLFFFHKIFDYLFPKYPRSKILLLLTITKDCFLIFLFFATYYLFYKISHSELDDFLFSLLALASLGIVILLDLFFRFLGTLFPKKLLKKMSMIVSCYLLILFPLTGLFLKIVSWIWKRYPSKDMEKLSFYEKERVLHMIKESDLGRILSPTDEKYIASFLTFREKVVREIMIPRVDVFSLKADTTIRQAAKIFVSEDYSRIPVYGRDSDDILGVMMYKDLLKIIAKADEDPTSLDTSIETISKPVIYVPENKKISHLFQEFRSKKSHMAIVVNEYGAIEGIVTIEDILEELVGEIEDEYDISEERQFWEIANGSYIIDAKMSINDIEEKLDIYIPHNPEYETIGGYIFYHTGAIPEKGFCLHHDTFDLEVLVANDRSIEKVLITPIKPRKKISTEK